jgi:hypothetical protein
MFENESVQCIKVFRNDRRGEYESYAFHEFCYHHGIQRRTYVAKTPQQKWVERRKNQSIMGMVGCILKGRHLSDQFWVEGD